MKKITEKLQLKEEKKKNKIKKIFFQFNCNKIHSKKSNLSPVGEV